MKNDDAKPWITENDNGEPEIREREQAATPGPWRAVTDSDKSAIRFGTNWREIVVESQNHHYPEGFGQKRGGVVHSWDAEFIAHAREDIPWLLKQLAAKDAEIERLRSGDGQLRLAITAALEEHEANNEEACARILRVALRGGSNDKR